MKYTILASVYKYRMEYKWLHVHDVENGWMVQNIPNFFLRTYISDGGIRSEDTIQSEDIVLQALNS